jgi:hypothetical protein
MRLHLSLKNCVHETLYKSVKFNLRFFDHNVRFNFSSRLIVRNLLKFHFTMKFQQNLDSNLNLYNLISKLTKLT